MPAQLDICFSPWTAWESRAAIRGANQPGVYLLAHLPSIPRGSASPLEPRIVYIGETHRQTLLARWRAFARSAKTGRFSHAGGRSYHARFKGLCPDLYVAAFAPDHERWTQRCRTFLIRYVESKLIWDFATKYSKDKLCNRD